MIDKIFCDRCIHNTHINVWYITQAIYGLTVLNGIIQCGLLNAQMEQKQLVIIPITISAYITDVMYDVCC